MSLFSLDDPRQVGLLSLGLRLMSTPGPFGQALGQSGMGALYDAQAVKGARQERELRDMQRQQMQMALDAAKRQQEGEARTQAYMQDAIAGPDATMAESLPGPRREPEGFNLQRAMAAGVPFPVALQMAAQFRPKEPDEFTLSPGQVRFRGTQQLGSVPATPEKESTDVQNYRFAVSQGYKGDFTQWKRENARAGASNTSVSYGAPVAGIGPDGKPVFIQPAKDGSAPAVVPGIRPPKTPAEERAEAEKATRNRQSQQMLSVLNDAEAILKEGNATGSGIGTMADIAGRGIGITTKGAIDSSRLEALSGWLVANVPRMEGPQSNYDVENYKVMAGKVGDSRVPREERLAALKEVRKLQQKYAAIDGGAPLAPNVDSLVDKYRSR